MNYTKGEWRVIHPIVVKMGHGNTVKIGLDLPTTNTKLAEAKANAHLIAAAPMLYETLKEAYDDGLFDGYDDIEFNRIKQALSKAEGTGKETH